jgi:hypothetical protein
MRASGDLETLTSLALVAVDREVYSPVWEMLEKVPYDVRADLVVDIGAACTEHPNLPPFLQGAYYGLRAPQFASWQRALEACGEGEFVSWLEGLVLEPPAAQYDEKYNAVVGAYVKHRGIEAIPVLKQAAVAAAEGAGPFNVLIEKMDAAAQPSGFGAKMSDEDRVELESALVEVANAVSRELAGVVADRLYNAGSVDAAVSLLPVVHAEVQQNNGSFLYGVASVEHCDGSAWLHWATVNEPGNRWYVLDDVSEPARGFKGRLKCETEGPWPVIATSSPMPNKGAVQAWVDELITQWTEKGNEVKSKEEKAITLE